MSERFKELPEEKQLSILRAATEVFAKYEYKKASTDLIAAKAGVSKGLLFYYFYNKKDLYLTVFEYVKQSTRDSVTDPRLLEITDFFELISYASVKKLKMLAENPYMVQFAMRSFYSDKEEISDDLKGNIRREFEQSYIKYFNKIDLSKFKEDVNPFTIYKMMIWLADGYLHELQMNNEAICLDAFKTAFKNWSNMFKRIAYKEEYL